jgi:hypothetical protein
MIRFLAIIISGFVLITGAAFAEDDVDAAAKQLQSDAAKMKADIAAEADRTVLVADKQRIKADKAALNAARQSAKSELIKGHTSDHKD